MKLDTPTDPLYSFRNRLNYLLSELQQKIQEGKIPSPTRAKISKWKKCGIIEMEADKDERDRESKDNK